MHGYLKTVIISLGLALYFTISISYLLLESYAIILPLSNFSFFLIVALQVFREHLVHNKKISETVSLFLAFGAYYVVTLIFLHLMESQIASEFPINSSPWFYELLIITVFPLVLALWNLEVKLFNVNYRSITIGDLGEDSSLNLTLSSESTKRELSINLEELVMIEAEDNYCMIFFQKEDGIKKELFRSTLTKMHEQLDSVPEIHRVHRSFLVNEKAIERISGKSQSYKIRMRGLDKTIPVSRSFDIKELKTINH